MVGACSTNEPCSTPSVAVRKGVNERILDYSVKLTKLMHLRDISIGKDILLREINLKLREAGIFEMLNERWHIDNKPGVVEIKNAGLPPGTLEVVLILSCAGLQRFIQELFLESARVVLGLNPTEITKFQKNPSYRVGNPNPKNIANIFITLGVFDIFSPEDGDLLIGNLASKINDLVNTRNRAVHGSSSDNFDDHDNAFNKIWLSAMPDKIVTKEEVHEIMLLFEDFASNLYDKVKTKVEYRVKSRVC